jgi:hypothetical protein
MSRSIVSLASSAAGADSPEANAEVDPGYTDRPVWGLQSPYRLRRGSWSAAESGKWAETPARASSSTLSNRGDGWPQLTRRSEDETWNGYAVALRGEIHLESASSEGGPWRKLRNYQRLLIILVKNEFIKDDEGVAPASWS